MESPFYFRFILKIRFRHTKNESWFIGIFHYLLPCYQWRSLNHPSHQRPEIDFEILVHIFLVERHILLALSAYDAVDNLIQRFFCSLLVRITHNESDIVVILLDCVDNGRELYFLLLGSSVPALEPFFIELLQDNIKFFFVVIACACTAIAAFVRSRTVSFESSSIIWLWWLLHNVTTCLFTNLYF